MMVEIPPGKGSDWQEREAWTLHPPSMSDRAAPRRPGGVFVNDPIPSAAVEIPRNMSSDFATRDVYMLVEAGGTPQPDPPPPEEGGGAAQSEEPEVHTWDAMTRHAELDEFAADQDLPDDWMTMNIAAKKEWLDENYVPED